MTPRRIGLCLSLQDVLLTTTAHIASYTLGCEGKHTVNLVLVVTQQETVGLVRKLHSLSYGCFCGSVPTVCVIQVSHGSRPMGTTEAWCCV